MLDRSGSPEKAERTFWLLRPLVRLRNRESRIQTRTVTVGAPVPVPARREQFLQAKERADAAQYYRPGATFVTTKRKAWMRRLVALAVILLPTLAMAAYCYAIAAPMYMSSLRFTIRGQSESGTSSVLGKLMQSGGGGGAFTDGFAVRDYLSSFDALTQLNKKADFIEHMQRPKGDFVVNLGARSSKETVLDFYRRVVKVRYNMVEGIVSVDVFAFTPQDAFAFAAQIMDIAGEFSNDLNRRATEDSVRVASDDLKSAEERLGQARLALNDWRKRNANLDLEANAKMISQNVGALEGLLISARAELDQMKSSGTLNNPRRKSVEDRIKSVTQQLAEENARLTGGESGTSVVNLLAEYQSLNLTQEFASKNYELAVQSMHNARTIANVRQKYVATIVSPTMPEEPSYPDSTKLIVLTFIGALFMYLVGTMTWSVVRESNAA